MTDSRPRALVLIADGTEEMEFTIIVDVLRRADVEVVVAGLDGPDPVTCSREVRIVPDVSLAEVHSARFDVVVLPGGGDGARKFCESARVGELLRRQEAEGSDLAAICAAPSALAAHSVAGGKELTSHPSVREVVAAHGTWREDPVVADGPVVTSRGPGTAFAFAFALVRRLCGDAAVERVRAPMMFSD